MQYYILIKNFIISFSHEAFKKEKSRFDKQWITYQKSILFIYKDGIQMR